MAVPAVTGCRAQPVTSKTLVSTGVTDPTATAEWHRDGHSRKQHGAAGLQ